MLLLHNLNDKNRPESHSLSLEGWWTQMYAVDSILINLHLQYTSLTKSLCRLCLFSSLNWPTFSFLKWANPSLFFVYFRLFQHDKNQYKLIKVLMVCLGLEPRAARWNVQTNPLSYADDSNRFVQPFAVLLTRHHYADVWSLQSSSQRVK